MAKRKWMKDDKYVHIEEGLSVDLNSQIHFVSSNAFGGSLPVKWRDQVATADREGVEALTALVAEWAGRNGFTEVKP